MAKQNAPSGPRINIGISEDDRAAIAGGLSRLLKSSWPKHIDELL